MASGMPRPTGNSINPWPHVDMRIDDFLGVGTMVRLNSMPRVEAIRFK